MVRIRAIPPIPMAMPTARTMTSSRMIERATATAPSAGRVSSPLFGAAARARPTGTESPSKDVSRSTTNNRGRRMRRARATKDVDANPHESGRAPQVGCVQAHNQCERETAVARQYRAGGHLLITEVLDAARRLCLSQDCRATAMLGTGLRDRLRDARAMYVRHEATKKAICWPFVKPSDGLEPSTPSLPWRFRASTTRPLNSACWRVVPATRLVLVPRRTPFLKTPEPPRETLNLSPKPVPKNAVYEHRRSRHLLMCVARKLTFGPDIRLLMIRAVADVTDESALLRCSPITIAKGTCAAT
jgi:hypothetical protein